MAIYNLSNLSTGFTLDHFIVQANIYSNDLFGLMFLLATFVIVFVVAQARGDFAVAITSSLYVTSIISILALGVGFIALAYAFIPVVLISAATAMLFVFRET